MSHPLAAETLHISGGVGKEGRGGRKKKGEEKRLYTSRLIFLFLFFFFYKIQDFDGNKYHYQ